MTVTEAEWMAYVDGELDAAAAARVESAMRDDPELSALVGAQQRLRDRLRQAHGQVLQEPVPERLRSAAAGASAARGRPRASTWLAMAASLAMGVLLATWWQPGADESLRVTGDGLSAAGSLEDALDRRLTADGAADGVAVGLSFRALDGGYCRNFVLEPRALAGLACGRAGDWRIVALAGSQPAGRGLRQASTALPPAVLAEVDARLQGEPLDRTGEQEARATGWR